MELKLALGECRESFEMEKAVCNHGSFMMSPNVWIPATKSLARPLRLADSCGSVSVTITHPPNHPFILIQLHHVSIISSADEAAILEQVGRMLRISEKDERDVREFQGMHPTAKEKGFGRIFRSPSLFEDAVKSILLCNCRWKRTLSMARALCQVQAEIVSKGKRSKRPESEWNFPSWKELLGKDANYLNQRCKLGYRADWILQLATVFSKGILNEDHIMTQLQQSTSSSSSHLNQQLTSSSSSSHLNQQLTSSSSSHMNQQSSSSSSSHMNQQSSSSSSSHMNQQSTSSSSSSHMNQQSSSSSSSHMNQQSSSSSSSSSHMNQQSTSSSSSQSLYQDLLNIKGFGPFASSNVMMCVGFYNRVPSDTETIRHLKQVHGKENCSIKTIERDVEEIYGKYNPFQCLAYWLELVDEYENKSGKLSELDATSYHLVTGTFVGEKFQETFGIQK